MRPSLRSGLYPSLSKLLVEIRAAFTTIVSAAIALTRVAVVSSRKISSLIVSFQQPSQRCVNIGGEQMWLGGVHRGYERLRLMEVALESDPPGWAVEVQEELIASAGGSP